MAEKNIEFPYSIRDVHISDPFILVDEKSGFYYKYRARKPLPMKSVVG